LLRLEIQAPGENDSSWGDKASTIFEMIEDGIAGRASITHDNAASYSLTTANSATDEARNMMLNIAGTLTVARNTVVPTSSKLYFAKNATVGGFATTLKTSAGTGISIPNGKSTVLICDGTNVVEAIDYLSSLTVGGALAVDGATTLNGNVTIGNATGDALTFHPSAWTLTNAVTITGTWTNLGTVTTADINGGTIDGAVIGGASAAAGTFTALSATGNVTLGDAVGDTLTIAPNAVTWSNNPTHSGNHTWSGVHLGSAGSASAPTYSFSGNTNYGWYLESSVLKAAVGGGDDFGVSGSGPRIPSSNSLAWSSTTSSSGSADVFLERHAANTLALRNGVNAQGFLLYNTFTDISNYERLEFSWVTNRLTLSATAAGTGTARGLDIGGAGMSFYPNGTASNTGRWNMTTTALTPSNNNTTDVGASSTTARTGYFGTSVVSPTVSPGTNDAGALGSATVSWSDLFLASGALIGFANGDAVLTHSTGILTVSTGDLRVTTAGTNAASAVTVGGTQTLTSKTLTAPVLGAATATSINGLTITSSTGTFTLTNSKTLSVSNTLTLAGTDSTTITFPASSAAMAALNIEDQALTGGVIVTSKSLGTISSGTVTPDPGDRPLQHYTNGGAHTLAPSANVGSILVDITNDASAGAITTSGFTKVAGDAFTTTNAHKFRCHISIGSGGSLLSVQAMQ